MDGKILMDDDAMEDVEGKIKRFSACSHANFFPYPDATRLINTWGSSHHWAGIFFCIDVI